MAGPRSLWLQEALRAEDGVESQELLEHLTADLCIVGGGYTGLWTALRIKELEPGADVVVVEQDICGGGPSGRNGGFALTWWSKIPTLIKRVGEEEAIRLAKASEEAVAEIGAFCEREGVDAQYRRGGWLWTATAPAQVGAWRSSVETAEAHGFHPYELLSAEECVNTTDSAVRLTYKPGTPEQIIVTCQNERSQLQNKETAMRVLRGRLLERELQRQREERARLKGEHRQADFGSQMRTYYLHPYTLVKDHRTEFETSNVQTVLDGELDPFIEAYLRWNIGRES